MSDNENPTPEPGPEPGPEPIPQPAAPTEPVPAAGAVPTKVRWRDRVFGLRAVLAVALAGLILGAGAGVGTTLLVDDDHGDGPGRHWMDGPGRGEFPGRGDFPGRGGPGQGQGSS